jgi:hypothetical protein
MKHAKAIAVVTAVFLFVAPSQGSGAQAPRPRANVPLFARFATEGASLRSYVVPVQANVTVHKIIALRARLAGNMRYAKPNRLDLTMNRVSPQQRRVFAKISTPRAWPQYYNLRVTRTSTIKGHKYYVIRGVPKTRDDAVDHLIADVSDARAPQIYAQWFLRGKGTITMRIQTAMVRGYVLPVRNQTDIDVPGYRVHADVTYGRYALSGSRRSKVSLR